MTESAGHRRKMILKALGNHAADLVVTLLLSHSGLSRIDPPPGSIAIDPHTHSTYSDCSCAEIERLILRASQVGLGGIAILDHNDFRSAATAAECAEDLKRRKLISDDFIVIPGMEITSELGHIGGIFLNEPVPKRLSVEETVERIHDAGGLAVAVHPYDKSGIGDALFDAPFDAVEVECGSVLRQSIADRIRELREDDRLRDTAKLGSSDTHFAATVGMCCTIVRVSDLSHESIKTAIADGRTTAHPTETCLKIRDLIRRLPARAA